ncbi:MAG: helix-turn-helix domain-containing protein [bacterium]|nr:helix-turn-helix domain-containing protein [bacterium]
MSGNVVKLKNDFPDRLRNYREVQYLTQTDLAAKAGVSQRSVHELESGRRDRALSKTIMLLAEALGVSYSELIGNGSKPDHELISTSDKPPVGQDKKNRQRKIFVIRLLALFTISIITGLVFNIDNQVYVGSDLKTIEVRHGLFKNVIWSQTLSDNVKDFLISPWDGNVLLVALSAKTIDGGCLIAFDINTGTKLWTRYPDIEQMSMAFNPSTVQSGGFFCEEILLADLDGDGIDELVVHFMHNRWYPAAICVIGKSGNIESQYASLGHIYDIIIQDIDNDGKDEIVIGSTNNNPKYQGASLYILDEDNRSGASLDFITSVERGVEDGALVRIVVPAWPKFIMETLSLDRLDATKIYTYKNSDGQVCIQACIGEVDTGGFVFDFDNKLNLLSARCADSLKRVFNNNGINDFSWFDEWANSYIRFEKGQPAN